MTPEEIAKTEQMLKDAMDFYSSSPDGQYDEIAVICIRYAMTMKPWLGSAWRLPDGGKE